MQDPADRDDDPQWALVLEIASKLWYDGEDRFVVHPTRQQQLVDLQWAAHQAGRILGVRANVDVRNLATTDPRVVVSVTFHDPTGGVRARARDGLESLLRQVRNEHG